MFQAAAGKDFVAELALVAQRLEWLTAVLDGNEVSVNAKIAKLTKEAMEDGKSSAARSRDEACAARSGPCPGFEELKPFSCLTEHTMKFANCQSMEDIKEVSQAMNPAKKTFTVLASACKTSLADLQFARAKATDKAQEKERLEKERKYRGLHWESPPARNRGPPQARIHSSSCLRAAVLTARMILTCRTRNIGLRDSLLRIRFC